MDAEMSFSAIQTASTQHVRLSPRPARQRQASQYHRADHMIGRDLECDVQIDSIGRSRRHATIHWTGDRFVLTDLESFNGTFVNSERIWEHPLKNGDAIAMGECQLRFSTARRPCPARTRCAWSRGSTTCKT